MEDIQLSKNFYLHEFTKSNTADKYKISNEPNQYQIDNLKYLCQKCIQPARDHFKVPIRITSGFRSPSLNLAIGGSPSSFHCYGMAADIKFTPENNKYSLLDLFNFFYNSGVYTELIAEELPYGWIHVAIQNGRDNENQLKYKLAGGKVLRAPYEHIIAKIPSEVASA